MPSIGQLPVFVSSGSRKESGSLKNAYQFMKDAGENAKDWLINKFVNNSVELTRSQKRNLEGSLKNPNLSDSARQELQNGLDKANESIKKIEELFKPFGGIK